MRFWLPMLLLAASASANPFPSTDASEASDYWFDKAEITRYELTQNRYGEMRKGDSVLIFVTEPFLPEQQVKHEYGPGEDAIPVLKLNRIRSFTTGIYDYRLMASIFHPIHDYTVDPSGLKIAMSSTEWCGLVFQQVNRRNGALETQLRSYFQKEADQDRSFPEVWTEDELWLRLRIDPDSLPTGEFRALPELFFQRLVHLEPEVLAAVGSLQENARESTYEIRYPELDRTLRISFETDYPHRILGWKETFRGQPFTEARATDSERLYYWELNGSEDLHYRKKLGLPAE